MQDEDKIYQAARADFIQWKQELREKILTKDSNLMQSFHYYFAKDPEFIKQLEGFAAQVSTQIEDLVAENNQDENLPKVQHYNAIGEYEDTIIHHPSYQAIGDLIYSSSLMSYLKKPGFLLKTLSLFLLSSHAGEAGHNCPIACSAGLIRVLIRYSDLDQSEFYLKKLMEPSFTNNFTAAQFLTEIQGGSDVGANATLAYQDENKHWRIKGEKWFCSNANADLILMTARFDPNSSGTKGLGLFLIPKQLANGKANNYKITRLKQKLGTRSMATGEINFDQTFAFPIGKLEQGIHLTLENVLHLSRIFNAFSILGMARRAQQIAYFYAKNRSAFDHKIIEYPLIKESLARIRSENIVMLASVFHMVSLQDQLDLKTQATKEDKLLLRTLANLNKYFTAKRSVENIHHCLDVLAGNGTIESFSSLPRLLRDAIVYENWEGTHFTLWMQTLRDIEKFHVDDLFLDHLSQLFADLSDDFEYKSLLNNQIIKLQAKFKGLKFLDKNLQTLAMQELVEEMAVLYSALALSLEIQNSPESKSKKAALRFFVSLYFLENYSKDKAYLSLLDEVLA